MALVVPSKVIRKFFFPHTSASSADVASICPCFSKGQPVVVILLPDLLPFQTVYGHQPLY